MHTHAMNSDCWLCSRLSFGALVFAIACQPHPPVASSARHATPRPERELLPEEEQPAIAYCATHAPNTNDIAFALDYDGSDGMREPWFAIVAPTLSMDESSEPQQSEPRTVKYSKGAVELCKTIDRPTGRRYMLKVPINAEPRRLDEYVRFAARSGYDQPIFKFKNVVVAAQVANAEYGYSPTPVTEFGPTIGTVTVEANAEGNYELRARVTDGYELSEPIGVATVPRVPDLADCESKTADAVRQLCTHPIRPCERITLVGVNDIGPLLAVLAYVEAVADVSLPAVAFGQRDQGLDSSPYLDSSFRRVFRIRRFFAAMAPETASHKLGSAESLARRKLGLHAALPSSLTTATDMATEVTKRLGVAEWTEVGKTRKCESLGRTAASLVVDKNDNVRMYAEHIMVTERAEVLLRVYYDDAQRVRLVINSETTDAGESWDAYLLLGEDGCPRLEQIATHAELATNMLHWELKTLVEPRGAFGEPLCIGPLP